MSLSQWFVTGLFVLSKLATTSAEPLVERPSGRSHRTLRRATSVAYDPVHPSVLHNVESRLSGHQATKGDYIMQGLTNTINLVSAEYGLRESESFYWGPDGNPMANLTAYADDKAVRVLSLERFDNVLQHAECGSGSIKLTFTQEVQFDAVQEAWKWVNDADENYIILITASAQCNVADGDASVRQPWHVTDVEFNDGTNVVTLTAQPRTWAEAFSYWRLKINSRGLLPQHHSLGKRGTSQLDLSMDFSGPKMSLTGKDEEGEEVTGAIECTKCETFGSLDFDIDINPVICPSGNCFDSHLEGHFDVAADNIGATIEVTTSVSGSVTALEDSETIFAWEPPFGRIYVPGVIDLGPEVSFSIDASIGKVESEISLMTGLNITIPPDAHYDLNLENFKADVTSWVPQVAAIPPEVDASVSIGASIGGNLKLDYSGQALGILTGKIGFYLAAPIFYIDATAIAQEDACDIPDADAGLSLDVGVGMSMGAFELAEADLGIFEAKLFDASQTFFAASATLYSTCMEIAGTSMVPNTPTPSPTPTPTPIPSQGPPYYSYGNGTYGMPSPPAYPTAAAVRM